MAADRLTVEQVLSSVSLTADKVISIFTALLAAFMIMYSGYVLYDNIYTQTRAFGSSWDVLKYRPEIIDDGSVPLSAANMSEINEDYRAWLTVYYTNIDYPVMQGKDDLYYASHDVFKKSSLTGALYLSTDNSPDFSDSYNLIYGHHMDVDALFGGLDLYRNQEYFDTHKRAIVVTSDAVYDATIFAVLQTDAYDEMIYNAGERPLSPLLEYLKSKALIYDEQAAEGAVKIVAMSTCESATTAGRLIVFAKMVKRDNIIVPPVPDEGSQDNPPGITVPNEYEPGQGTPPPTIPEMIEDVLNPLKAAFYPTGGSYGYDAWALVNLICLILTFFLVLPIGFLRAKYKRAKYMDELNEEKRSLWYEDNLDPDEARERSRIIAAAMEELKIENRADVTEEDFDDGVEALYYEDRVFRRRFTIGTIVEIVLAICALILFILTEDMRLPMILIDSWTPFMILFLVATWLVDVRLARYRKPEPEEDDGSWVDPENTAKIEPVGI